MLSYFPERVMEHRFLGDQKVFPTGGRGCWREVLGQICLGNAHLNYFVLFYTKASQKFTCAMLLGRSQESSNHIRVTFEF